MFVYEIGGNNYIEIPYEGIWRLDQQAKDIYYDIYAQSLDEAGR